MFDCLGPHFVTATDWPLKTGVQMDELDVSLASVAELPALAAESCDLSLVEVTKLKLVQSRLRELRRLAPTGRK